MIASVGSKTQLKAIGDHIELSLKSNYGERPYATDGLLNSNWGVIDYSDVVVHIFLPETRRFYELERLWGDGVAINWVKQKQNDSIHA